MLRCFMMLLVALGCLSGFGALAQDKPALAVRGWGEVVDPDNDCRISVDGRKVVVTVPDAAHDFAGGKKVYGMGSKDGINWKSYDPIDADFPEVLTAGVEVINSSKSAFTCAFEDFAVFRGGGQGARREHAVVGIV